MHMASYNKDRRTWWSGQGVTTGLPDDHHRADERRFYPRLSGVSWLAGFKGAPEHGGSLDAAPRAAPVPRATPAPVPPFVRSRRSLHTNRGRKTSSFGRVSIIGGSIVQPIYPGDGWLMCVMMCSTQWKSTPPTPPPPHTGALWSSIKHQGPPPLAWMLYVAPKRVCQDL
jgi:hypothetical protein